jgi:geranylgeranyl diphosphate synthase type II
MFHNFTLVHDDIMDHSSLRRGQKTVHEQWNEATAILSGDVMLVLAYELLNEVDQEILAPVLRLFNDTAKKVCEGQQLDMTYETAEKVSMEDYTGMIGMKTAALLAGSLKMGALLAKSPVEDAENIYEFGYQAGIAFQLQDDLLDAYGDVENFGKKIGGDIVSNKKTFLTVKAFEIAEDQTLQELKNLFSGEEPEPVIKIQKVLAAYDRLGIKKMTEKVRDMYFSRGIDHLDKIKAPEKDKQMLRSIAELLINREN